jgi:hypothetical protein
MSFPLAVVGRHLLQHVPVLNDLASFVEAEDVYARGFERLVVRMHSDELPLGDHPMHLDVYRAHRGEEILHCLQAVAGLRVVLPVALDHEFAEGVGVSGPEGVEQLLHSFLVALCRSHAILSCSM